MPKRRLQEVYRERLFSLERRGEFESLARDAVIFAPHPDDETLGCGGTIIRKVQAGAKVKIVFLADGRSSHQHLIRPEVLAALRAQEAVAAGKRLGLREEDVIFLNYPDGGLRACAHAAVENVLAILCEHCPAEVFIPYFRDAQVDHIATNMIVRNAIKRYSAPVIVHEYPIWFWFHWPWVSFRQPSRAGIKAVIRNTLSAQFGLRLLKDFNYSVRIDHMLAQKQAALEAHRSQMVRLIPDPSWATLVDFSYGEFLVCFFQPYEVFHRYCSP